MLTAVVLTKNEAARLPHCLESLRFCDSVLVVDDNSHDQTTRIAKKFGAKVITHPLNSDFSSQRNYALTQVQSGWILFVDADEEVSPKLAQEIRSVITQPDFSAYQIPRHDYLWGKKIKYGDLLEFKVLRLAKKNTGKWVGKVHEQWRMDIPVGTLESPLHHYPHPNLYAFLAHLNQYSSLRAQELYDQGVRETFVTVVVLPIVKFLYLYILKLGFLDGIVGLIHALAMSFYTFLSRGKLYLLKKGISVYG